VYDENPTENGGSVLFSCDFEFWTGNNVRIIQPGLISEPLF